MPGDKQIFATLINRDGHQYVVFPEGIFFGGKRVKVTRVAEGILIEPEHNVRAWLKELEKYADEPFMEDGRQQPPMPPPKDLFD